MTPYVNNAGTFLISVIFGFFIFGLLLRFILQWVRADFYNPISQIVVQVTDPIIKPVKKFIPPIGSLDSASLVMLVVLQIMELAIIGVLNGEIFAVTGLLFLSLAKILSSGLNILFFAILIEVIISWVSPGVYNPMITVVQQIASLVLNPARRLIPSFSGLDISPIVAIVFLQLIEMTFIAALADLGKSLLLLN
jgi:YggT family protein